MHLASALVDYDLYCRQKNVSPQTRRWYEHKLRYFATWLHEQGTDTLDELRPATVHRFTEHLRSTGGFDTHRGGGVTVRSDHTVKGYVQVIKGFLAWAGKEDLISERVARRVDLPRVEQRLIRTLSREQYYALTVAATFEQLPWLMHRDRAILAVLLDTGIRASELCGLCAPDLRLDRSDPYLTVFGKGRKEREVGPLGTESAALLRRYLNRSRPKVARPEVFLSKHHTPLTPSGLDQTLYRLERWAGADRFDGVRVSAHTFRHTYAVNFLKAGGSIHDLRLLLGHTTLATTMIYLRDYTSADARKGRSVLDSWDTAAGGNSRDGK